MQAFADDLVFVLENPLESTLKLLKQIEKFGDVADKLIVQNMMDKHKNLLIEKTKLQTVKRVKYLGIYLTA